MARSTSLDTSFEYMKTKLVHQFKIALLGISPPIWRRIQIPENYSFWELHVAIQDSMGWLDYHLHAFDLPSAEGRRQREIGIPENESDDLTIAGWKTKVADHFIRPGVAMSYRYDFGDGWVHEVLLEAILVAETGWKYPRCIAGERACPPEDCGGTDGYFRLIETLSDAEHPARGNHISWLKGHAKNYHPYDPAYFDPQVVRFANPKRRWTKAFAETGRHTP